MTSRNISDLNKDFQPMVTKLLEQGQAAIAHTGYTFFITDGYRSMDDQAKLYAQGRTTTGNVVTMAAPGQSPHNYGLAVDIAFQKSGKLYYGPELYALVYPIARQLGFALGVDWERFKDAPHFEYPNWQAKVNDPTGTVFAMHAAQRNVTIIVERGANVRSNPTTTALVVTALPFNKSIAVKGFVEGQKVSGNNVWWVTADDTYVWSGATNVIPTIPVPSAPNEPKNEVPPAPPQTEPMPTSTMNSDDLLKNQVATLTTLLEEKEAAITELSQAASQVIGLKNANLVLSDQIGAYKSQVAEIKEKLRTVYVRMFEHWELVELPTGASRYRLLLPLLFQVMGLFISDPKLTHVIGWKRNARITSNIDVQIDDQQ